MGRRRRKLLEKAKVSSKLSRQLGVEVIAPDNVALFSSVERVPMVVLTKQGVVSCKLYRDGSTSSKWLNRLNLKLAIVKHLINRG